MAVKTFTTGEVLTASDTNTYLNNGGLVYITGTTIGSAVSSVTVSNVFSSTYDNYRVLITGGTGSGANNLAFQFASITGTVYRQLGYYQGWGSATVTDYADGAGSTTWLAVNTSGAYMLDMLITNPYNAVKKFAVINGYNATNQYSFPSFCDSTTSSTGFTVSLVSGTLTGGTVRVYGYRQA